MTRLLILLGFCLALAACGSAPSVTSAPPPEAASMAAQVGLDRCVGFDWMRLPGSTSDRSLMRVPVTVGGERSAYQFDTGAYDTYVYADSAFAADRAWPLARDGQTLRATTDLSIGGHTVADNAVIMIGARASGVGRAMMRLFGIPRTEGTLGLSALEGTVALIDYPSQQLCILDAPPEALALRTAWTPAVRHRDSRVLLSGQIGSLALDSLLFDTGSSVFPLTLDLSLWREATGRTGKEPDTERLGVSAWGEQVAFVGAPARGPLVIGAVRQDAPQVYAREAVPTYHAARGYGGVLGNAPFWDGGVLLDLRGEVPRFGIVQTASAD